VIEFGSKIRIAALCPDCLKPMNERWREAYQSLYLKEPSEFASLVCDTEDCISRHFITVIEKRSGAVIYTNAEYDYDYEKHELKRHEHK
jgi:hypothetical protein